MSDTLTQAYLDAGGYTLRNARWSWSARRSDPPGVALTAWEDETDQSVEPWIYRPSQKKLALWIGKLGNQERIENIRFGLARCGGCFDIVWIKVRNPDQEPRRILSRRFLSERFGIVRPEAFDPSTGMFCLELHRRT